MTRLISLVLCAGLFSVEVCAQNGFDTTAGEALWPHCAFCHTDQGLGYVGWDAPMIAGQEAWYTERQLKNFIERRRGHDSEDLPGLQMAIYTGPLIDDEIIASTAAFIESLPVTPAQARPHRFAAFLGFERPYDWESQFGQSNAPEFGSEERGRELYATCAACHGQNLEGNQALNSPRLDNKQEWYLIRQLQYFKYGVRGSQPDDVYGQQMAAMMAVLPDEQAIADVVAYMMTMSKVPCLNCESSRPSAPPRRPPQARMPARGEFFEISLIDRPADEPRGWCIDAAGAQANAIMVGGVHGHTCYSYEGNYDYHVAVDQRFAKTDIEELNRFRLEAFDHCLTLAEAEEGSWIALTPCDDRAEQGFQLTDDGRIRSLAASELCVTLGTQTVPGGGGSPVHQLRELLMQRCSDELASLQQWRLRDYRDW